jgi:hypothetical protein
MTGRKDDEVNIPLYSASNLRRTPFYLALRRRRSSSLIWILCYNTVVSWLCWCVISTHKFQFRGRWVNRKIISFFGDEIGGGTIIYQLFLLFTCIILCQYPAVRAKRRRLGNYKIEREISPTYYPFSLDLVVRIDLFSSVWCHPPEPFFGLNYNQVLKIGVDNASKEIIFQWCSYTDDGLESCKVWSLTHKLRARNGLYNCWLFHYRHVACWNNRTQRLGA